MFIIDELAMYNCPKGMNKVVLYCIVLYCIVLYCTVSHDIATHMTLTVSYYIDSSHNTDAMKASLLNFQNKRERERE